MQYRKSKQRDLILKVLRNTKVHPTADWIYNQLKKNISNLSIGTVYRNLKILSEQKLIKKLPLGSTFDRYEAVCIPHYHFICEQCGGVYDVDIPKLSHINMDVEKRNHCTITHHTINFFGRCDSCCHKESLNHLERSM